MFFVYCIYCIICFFVCFCCACTFVLLYLCVRFSRCTCVLFFVTVTFAYLYIYLYTLRFTVSLQLFSFPYVYKDLRLRSPRIYLYIFTFYCILDIILFTNIFIHPSPSHIPLINHHNIHTPAASSFHLIHICFLYAYVAILHSRQRAIPSWSILF